MATADASTLRPLTLGQILDRALRLYRQQFLTFIGIIAAMLVPITGLQVLLTLINAPNTVQALEELQNNSTLASNPMALFATQMSAMGGGNNFAISILMFILVQGFAMAALVRAIADSYLGEPVEILGSYKKITRVWGPLLGALLLWVVLYIGIGILTLIPCVGWFVGPGVIIFFVYVLQPLIPVAVVLEGQKGLGAIRRTWDLARRRFWWTLGFMVILGIFAYVLLVGPTLLLQYGLVFGMETGLPNVDAATRYGLQTGISQLVSMLMQLLYLPIQLTAVTLMYFDLRVRTEGFDIAMMAAGKPEAEGETPASVVAQVPVSPSGGLVTSREVAYFAGISLGIIVICGGTYVALVAFIVAAMGAGNFGP